MFRSTVGDALNDAREKSNYYGRAASGGGIGASGPGSNPLGLGGGGALGQSASRQTTLTQHAEQYRHYNGWVHGSIGPIAKRIARQPVRLAEVPTAQPEGDVGGKPPVPSVPGGRKMTGTGTTSYKRKPWEKPSDPREIAKHHWFKKSLPGSLKAYFETAQIIDAHPLLDAINEPNSIMVRWTLIFVTVASLLLTGKGYWWVRARPQEDIEANPGSPKIEIWPVPASWITPVHTNGKLYHHWEIRAEGASKAEEVPPEQIIYFYLPDPASPLGAHSPLQAQARAVVADEAISEAQRRGFANGTFPGMAIVVGRMPDINGQPGERPLLNQPQRAQLITAFKQAYRGVYNTDEPIILDQMIQDIKRISMTNREMDYMESGKYTKDRITQGFGVNPISMGQVEGANRASSATADDHLCQNTVNPLIELISETITAWMNPLFAKKGQKLLIFLEEAYAYDPDSERADYDLLWRAGAIQKDELRAGLKGLPPVIDGEECLVPAGMVSISCARVDQGAELDSHTRATKNSEPEPETPDLPVPMIYQTYPYDCGAASGRMAAEFAGIDAGTEEEFMIALRVESETGTSPKHLFDYFAHHGCEPKRRDRLSIENLRQEIRKGRPILCPMQYKGDGPEFVGGTEPSGHWVIVVGVSKEGVRFHDPIDGPSELPFRAWLDNWHDTALDGRPYVRFGLSVGQKPKPFADPTVTPTGGRSTAYHCKAHTLTEEERISIWDKSHGEAEKSIATALLGFFRGERERVLAALPDALKTNKTWLDAKAAPLSEANDESEIENALDYDENLEPLLEKLIPLQSTTRRLRAAVKAPLLAVAEDGAAVEVDAIKPTQKSELATWEKAGRPVDRKPLDKTIRDRVNAHLEDMVDDPYWEDINKTTRLKMSRAIRRGLANNETIEQIETRIRGALSDTNDQIRAQVIARTEATAALNVGFQAAREHYGPKFVKGKKWVSSAVNAHVTRQTHKEANGQTRKNGSKFRVGGVHCEFPGDPVLPAKERCNCNCVALTIPAD